MTRKNLVNVAASVKQRLINICKKRGDEPNLIFIQYALERMLYRLSKSKYVDQFILKGAMLFAVWTEQPHRYTRDLDLLGSGNASKERLTELIQCVCKMKVEPDGLLFDEGSITVSDIRRDQEYFGQRIRLTALLGSARIPVQIDIGFGDAFTPYADEIEFPTILDFPAPRIRAYDRETVVAEKFNAMVMLGKQNSRMKDFYDIFVLARDFAFTGANLAKTIPATFERRGMIIPTDLPLALTDAFGSDNAKEFQWRGFIRRSRLKDVPEAFGAIVSGIRDFLEAPIVAAAAGKVFSMRWPKGGPWK